MARDEQIKLSLVDGVTKSLGQIRDGVSGVGAQLAKLNQVADLAGKAFGLVGSAVSAIGSNVQGVADLESTLAVIQERTQATAAEMGLLRQAISAATRDGKASIEDAAAALAELTKEGLSATQSAQALGPVLAFAASNATNASQAVGSLLDILGGFNAPADGIASLADKLTALSRATGAPVESLQKGLAGISVQADAANLSLDQSLVLIGALANRSIEGGRASAALTKALAELTDPASKAGEALKEVGGNTADVMQALRLLAADAGKAEAVLSQFGAKPRLALQALLADGGAALDGLQQKLDEATGSSQAASDAIGDTFNRAVVALQNSVANLRNEFLAPILGPLADEAQAVAEKLNALSDSPQFARIRDQFQELATNAIRSVGDLIEKADLEEWAGNVAEFGTEAKLVFDDVAYVAGKTADAIRGVSFAIKFLRGDKDLFSDSVDSLADGTERLGRAGADAGDTIADLGGNLASGERQTRSLVSEVLAAVGRLKEFASSMIEAGRASARASDDIATIFSPSEQAREQLLRLSGGAEQAAIGLERLRLAALTSAIAALARENLQGTDTFRALVAEVAKTESSIAKMQEAIDKARGAQKDLSDQTDSAANSLRNFSAAADSAGAAAENASGSNSQVAKSFGNIGKQAAAASADLGNMSQALIDSALAMQAQARSGREIIEIWEGVTSRYNEANARIQQAIDLIERQNAATDEESRLRRQLQAQYGTDSTLIEKLVQLKMRENQERERSIDLSRRETEEIERRNAAQSGALNFGQPAAAAESGATSSRGSAAGGGRSAPQIVINVQGMTTDQARAFVEQSVVPELERINRLSR